MASLDISMLEPTVEDSSSEDDSLSEEEIPDKFSEYELPEVSIVTPTYNRKDTIKLAVINFLSFDYPKDKLEWIIIDDGKESIRDILPDDDRIKYYYLDKLAQDKLYNAYVHNIKKQRKKKKNNKPVNDIHYKTGHFINNHLPLGLKRNLGVAYSNFNYIIHMDDDDYYPKDSIKERIFKMLENPKIQCLGCNQINQFHTSKMASLKTKTADDMHPSSRIYESTLCYHKNFWKKQRFYSGDMSKEGKAFLKNRSSLCEILLPDKVIVSLIHRGNQKGYNNLEANGWHFEKIPDELFLLITSF